MRNDNDETPLLSISTYYNVKQNIDFLLDQGAHINAKNIDGDTSLHKIVDHVDIDNDNDDEVIQNYYHLIERGADITIPNKKGNYGIDFYSMQYTYYMDDDVISHIHRSSYAAKGWEKPEVESKVETMLYTKTWGLPLDVNKKDPPHWKKNIIYSTKALIMTMKMMPDSVFLLKQPVTSKMF